MTTPPQKKRKTDHGRTGMLTRSQRHKLRDTTVFICSVDVSKFLGTSDANALRRTSKQNYDLPSLAKRFNATHFFIHLHSKLRLQYLGWRKARKSGYEYDIKHPPYMTPYSFLESELNKLCYKYECKRRKELTLKSLDVWPEPGHGMWGMHVERVFWGVQKYGSFRKFSCMYGDDFDIRCASHEDDCRVGSKFWEIDVSLYTILFDKIL